jgi:hypothetical protein
MGIALGEMRVALAEFIDIAIRENGGGPLPEPPRLRRVGSSK